jgi:uncharacterized protein (DUF362 family)
MEREHSKHTVSIVKYDGSPNSLAEALTLSNCLEGLQASDKVLIKPNILWGGTPSFPPFGRVVTAAMVESLLQILQEWGCTDISIGEGAILNQELGSTTERGFEWSGIGRVAERYGVKLVDFNAEPHERIQLGDVTVRVSSQAFAYDFLIDLPVLKSHRQTKISLGMKNLKGFLAPASKRNFHRHDLDRLIALLNMRIRPQLTIIDGIYGLEKGPEMLGTPRRMDLIIAGKDVFSCDIVGAAVMKIEPEQVRTLTEYASIAGRVLSLDEIEVKGVPIDEVAQPFEWHLSFDDIFRQSGIRGLRIQEQGYSCCSGCLAVLSAVTGALVKDCPGATLDGVELCMGGDVRPATESGTVLLAGQCAILANEDRTDAVRIEGCPPTIQDTLMALVLNGFPRRQALRIMMGRAVKQVGRNLGIYDEVFPAFGICEPPAFDRRHFHSA